MSYLLTILLVGAAGLGVLDLLRLRTGHWLADAGLSWLVGCGWYGFAAMELRIGMGVPYRLTTALVIGLFPLVAALARRRFQPIRASLEKPSENGGGPLARWLPRPWILWMPIAIYVAVVTVVIALHGMNTPTHTDDAERVRAYTPFLALDDAWPHAARELLLAAGPLPTFVPTVAWELTGRSDHFHVNYVVLTHLLAFLCLTLGLARRANRPERGWATAFALLSLPFLVYHLTSTYQDAVVALFAGATLLFIFEHARTRDTTDASSAFLLVASLALIKRDGQAVGGALATVLFTRLLLQRLRARIPVLLPTLHAFAPTVAYLACAVVTLGWAGAFPSYPTPADVSTMRYEATTIFARGLWLVGNAGMLYWVLPFAMAVRWRYVLRSTVGIPFLGALFVFAESAMSSIWVVPQWTLNQTTVHRSLLAPSALFAIWLANLLTEWQSNATQGPLP